MASVPATAGMIDAGVAEVAFDWTREEAVGALELDALAIHRDPALWDGVVRADAAQTAAALASCLPGERLWFWIAGPFDGSDPPLILQPIASDPVRDLFNRLVGDVAFGDGASTASGFCYMTGDGSLQFAGPDLDRRHLELIARWTRRRVGTLPQLARLVDCALAKTAGGVVAELIQDPSLWDGMTRPPAPASLAETTEMLARARPGERYWFWMTGTAADGGFLPWRTPPKTKLAWRSARASAASTGVSSNRSRTR